MVAHAATEDVKASKDESGGEHADPEDANPERRTVGWRSDGLHSCIRGHEK
jgi:hypothetical protein